MVAGKEKSKAFEQKILEAEDQIEKALLDLFCLEDTLQEICVDIENSFGLDFAGISLIFPDKKTIESVQGTGIAAEWAGRAKHYLEKDPNLRDIQADIVQTYQTEVISGWDSRLDLWLYEEYKHDQTVRVFTPILIIQDDRGKIVKNWFARCQWQTVREEYSEQKQHSIYNIDFPDEFKSEDGQAKITVIGTVETGYKDLRRIESEQLKALAELISLRAIDIWKAQLPHVLNKITESAIQILKADSATLHFLYEPEYNRYVYNVFSGRIRRQYLRECLPRPHGLGRQAIRDDIYNNFYYLFPGLKQELEAWKGTFWRIYYKKKITASFLIDDQGAEMLQYQNI